jgi:hypothetical protein
MRALSFLLTAGLLSSLGCLPLFANGGGYTKGLASTGAFKPFGIEQVEMLSERLEIDLHIEYAEVRIEYVLHNPGPKVNAEAGFPSAVERRRWMMGMPATELWVEQHKLEELEVTVDGQPVKLKVEPDDLDLKKDKAPSYKPESPSTTIKAWHVFSAEFDKGQTRRVTVGYRNPYAMSLMHISDDQSVGPLTMAYIFSSAAAWSGPIKQGTVTVKAVTADPKRVQLSHPKRFTRDGNVWQWLFSDFEPTLEDDLVITTRGDYFRQEQPMDIEAEEANRERLSYVGWGGKRSALPVDADGVWEAHRQDYKITASSTLASSDGISYQADLLAGNERPSTAWAEGVPGSGIGESITLTLPKPAQVKSIGIVNGYAETEELYRANNRVASFEVSVNGGKPARVAVPDERLTTECFYFELPPSEDLVKTVKLTIAEVYEGTSHDDTCLSDITLVVPLKRKPKFELAR